MARDSSRSNVSVAPAVPQNTLNHRALSFAQMPCRRDSGTGQSFNVSEKLKLIGCLSE